MSFRLSLRWGAGAAAALAAAALVGLTALPAAAAPTAGPAAASVAAHPGKGGASCSRTLPTGTSTLAVPFDGESFQVRVHVPTSDARRDLPLVLDLHGSNNNGDLQASVSGLDAIADAERFIVAEPTGDLAFPATLPGGNWAWNVPGVPLTSGDIPGADARDDLAYLTAVVDAIDSAGCVDDARVYATGYSGGGRMASALACAESDVFAAIAPVDGLRAGRADAANLATIETGTCDPVNPVPVITFHGTADPVNLYDGNADPRWGYSVEVATAAWADINGCRRGPVSTTVSDEVTKLAWSKCANGADVVLYRVTDGGHTWPGSPIDMNGFGMGSMTTDISASQLMWDFFEQHALDTKHPRDTHGSAGHGGWNHSGSHHGTHKGGSQHGSDKGGSQQGGSQQGGSRHRS
ncbi:polyhydroxybutyrate depolymerase [Agromyces terreus]|uniref:Polyhydroxybutyrate depolymerase n=1 Tax=Agromyces terreus TaxID=424795 RepID=A0A9X2H0E0_9MICO|nr:PHB depolymerase family esterase [Agromyces terreus]MCP2370633.1 polyhydroxybutyrate depolymerase [Agromyces terreus]